MEKELVSNAGRVSKFDKLLNGLLLYLTLGALNYFIVAIIVNSLYGTNYLKIKSSLEMSDALLKKFGTLSYAISIAFIFIFPLLSTFEYIKADSLKAVNYKKISMYVIIFSLIGIPAALISHSFDIKNEYIENAKVLQREDITEHYSNKFKIKAGKYQGSYVFVLPGDSFYDDLEVKEYFYTIEQAVTNGYIDYDYLLNGPYLPSFEREYDAFKEFNI